MTVSKGGRITIQESEDIKEYIKQGYTYEAISAETGRKAETIQKYVENTLMMNLSEKTQSTKLAEKDIKSSPEWKEIEKQLSPEEQEMFLHHWREIIAQFKNDSTHTEKLQVIDVIRNEILINRVMKKIYNATKDVDSYRHSYEVELLKDMQFRDTQVIIELQRKIADCNIAVGAYNKEYKELMEKKQSILADLKATRACRVKRIEDSKESLTGWVAAILAAPEIRRDLGINMEKFRIAQQVEYERLSDYHNFADGILEQPIISHSNIKTDNL